MNEQEIKDNLTQLWQRMVATENDIKSYKDMLAVYTEGLEKRTAILETARTKQIELNSSFLKVMNANPDKPSTTRSWWKSLPF